jgi:cytochrome P450
VCVVNQLRKEGTVLSTAHEVAARPTLFVDGFLEDPYAIYRQFQSQGSIHDLQWAESVNYWTVFSYAGVFSVLKDQRLSARRAGSILASLPESERGQFSEFVRLLGQWLVFMDAPEHSRLRKLMNKGFAPSAIELLRPQVEAIVDRMLAPLHHASEAELISQIAHPLPVYVIAELLGVSGARQSQLVEWSDMIAKFFGKPQHTVEEVRVAQKALFALTEYFRELVSQRRLNKSDDLVSMLIDIEADGEVLTEEELLAQCVMLLFGGHETTRNLIGNGMDALLQRPHEIDRLRDNPDLIRSGIEELLRFDAPVQFSSRVVKEEMELCGVDLHPGDVLMILFGAANRDPAQFKDPDTLDLTRSHNAHLSFGAGAHFCLGNQLARLESETAILRTLQQFPNMRPAAQPPVRAANFALRGFQSLPVAL